MGSTWPCWRAPSGRRVVRTSRSCLTARCGRAAPTRAIPPASSWEPARPPSARISATAPTPRTSAAPASAVARWRSEPAPTGSRSTSTWMARSTEPTSPSWPVSSGAGSEDSGRVLRAALRLAGYHVVVKAEGDSLARIREGLGQRGQRVAGPDGVGGRPVERRHRGGLEHEDLRDRPALLDDHLPAHVAADPLAVGKRQPRDPIVADDDVEAPRVVPPREILGVERHRPVAPSPQIGRVVEDELVLPGLDVGQGALQALLRIVRDPLTGPRARARRLHCPARPPLFLRQEAGTPGRRRPGTARGALRATRHLGPRRTAGSASRPSRGLRLRPVRALRPFRSGRIRAHALETVPLRMRIDREEPRVRRRRHLLPCAAVLVGQEGAVRVLR